MNNNGRLQATLLAHKFKNVEFDYIYSSDLSRTLETAEILSKNHKDLKVITNTDLRERSFGKYQGQILTRHQRHSLVDVESIDSMFQRCNNFYNQVIIPLLHSPEDYHIAIVSHGAIMSVFLRELLINQLQLKISKDVKLTSLTNTSVTKLIIKSYNKGRILTWSDDSHLDLNVNSSSNSNADTIGL